LHNFPEDRVEWLTAPNHPDRPELGERNIPFTRELFIERDDFMEEPPRKFHRLKPGGEVRLRNAYIVRCDEVIRDETGRVVEIRCSCDLDSRSGSDSPAAQRKVKGTIHWVSASHALRAQIRLYDRLFSVGRPDARDSDFREALNPDSLAIRHEALLEPSLADAAPGDGFQFERLGYFVPDPDGTTEAPVFNRAVTLRDTWAKLEKQLRQG
jgi:glutaminyl-tRNA synthetase